MAARITGKTQPRLWTPPLRTLTRRTSLGYEVADFAALIGEPMLPWQRFLVIHALELNKDGTPRFKTVLGMCGRQSGKSTAGRIVSLYRLYVTGARLIIGAAQDLSTSREQQDYMLDTIRGSAWLSPRLAHVHRATGDEWFRVDPITASDTRDAQIAITGGGRYKIVATSRKAGRGLSVDQLTVDELREQTTWDGWNSLYFTTLARPMSQVWCMSNAGDDRSVVLNALRESALSGRDPTIGLFEWSAPDDADLYDRQAWRQSIPALGYTTTESAIASAVSTSTPEGARTEILCQKVDSLSSAIYYPAWADCHDPMGTMDSLRDRIAVCFDVAPDSGHATLIAAARLPDGRARLEVAGAWTGSDQIRAELPALLARIKPKVIAWYPSGPAGAFTTILRPAAIPYGTEYTELTGGRAAQACMEFADLVRSRQVIHAGDEILNAHIRTATKLPSGDGWRFGRKDGLGHVDAAYAAAGATVAALAMPEPKRARIRIVG
jgi:hypothetical protein